MPSILLCRHHDTFHLSKLKLKKETGIAKFKGASNWLLQECYYGMHSINHRSIGVARLASVW
jgi:hypothetical protein